VRGDIGEMTANRRDETRGKSERRRVKKEEKQRRMEKRRTPDRCPWSLRAWLMSLLL
jgi:hypothetical protein